MRFLFFVLLITSFSVSFSQDSTCHCPGLAKKGKGSFYGSIGTHRIFFTKSDIHFKDLSTANYDFTLYDVVARDNNDLSFSEGIDAPQYSLRLGYYFNNSSDLGIELSFDHAKYIMVQDQKVRIKGQINGVKMNHDTILRSSFIEYEHTDGANYLMLSLLKRKTIIHSRNQKHWLSAVFKPGAGIVVPRTYSWLLFKQGNGDYHVSGFVVGLETGIRYDGFKHFFIEGMAKGSFANYSDVMLYEDGRARQKWWSLQTIITAGFQFPW